MKSGTPIHHLWETLGPCRGHVERDVCPKPVPDEQKNGCRQAVWCREKAVSQAWCSFEQSEEINRARKMHLSERTCANWGPKEGRSQGYCCDWQSCCGTMKIGPESWSSRMLSSDMTSQLLGITFSSTATRSHTVAGRLIGGHLKDLRSCWAMYLAQSLLHGWPTRP